jgi:hypothetical protein
MLLKNGLLEPEYVFLAPTPTLPARMIFSLRLKSPGWKDLGGRVGLLRQMTQFGGDFTKPRWRCMQALAAEVILPIRWPLVLALDAA